jgi:PAS domain S-box-containing protein
MSPNTVLDAALLFLIALLAYAAWRSTARARRSEKTLAERTRELQALAETLRQREERYQLIMDTVSPALYIREPVAAKPTLYISRAYETLWQQPRERLYQDSRAWLEPIHPDDLPGVLEAVDRDLQQGIPLNIAFRLLHPDGTLRWAHIQNFHIHDNAGKVQYIVGIIEDITDLKQAEQDRLRLALERERSDVLRRLINELSHDFRTPLTIIITSTYLLKRDIAPERRLTRLSQIEDQAKRIDQLVQAALTRSDDLNHQPP